MKPRPRSVSRAAICTSGTGRREVTASYTRPTLDSRRRFDLARQRLRPSSRAPASPTVVRVSSRHDLGAAPVALTPGMANVVGANVAYLLALDAGLCVYDELESAQIDGLAHVWGVLDAFHWCAAPSVRARSTTRRLKR